MIYNDLISYDEPNFRYDGVKVVSPESIGLSTVFGSAKLLAVLLIRPISIDSTLIFVDSSKIIIPTGGEEVTTTSATMSFQDPNAEGYIAFNVLQSDVEAITSAETIYVSPTAESSFDVTIV